jgi:hypothetical protein
MKDYMQADKYDEFFTPAYAVEPLLKYIPKKWTAWEPTDSLGKSEITKALRKNGNKVVSTGKKTIDFLSGDAPAGRFDCIVTNPPYSLKDDFLLRCFELEKPFALLLPITALEGVRRGKLFNEMGERLGVLVLDRRVEFTGGSVWFNVSWFCCGILPRQLVFERLEKPVEAKKQTISRKG